MVCEGDWELLARGLVERGLCKVMSEEQLHHIGSQPLLNGLFAVGKDEVKNNISVSRLIMNLKPWNAISHSLSAEVGTLPSITQMGALYIHDNDVLVTSSEDLRCFFYLFKVPGVVPIYGFWPGNPPFNETSRRGRQEMVSCRDRPAHGVSQQRGCGTTHS